MAVGVAILLAVASTFLIGGYADRYCSGNLLKGPLTCPGGFSGGSVGNAFLVGVLIEFVVAPIYSVVFLLWLLKVW